MYITMTPIVTFTADKAGRKTAVCRIGAWRRRRGWGGRRKDIIKRYSTILSDKEHTLMT
jgi:hypothetical protein